MRIATRHRWDRHLSVLAVMGGASEHMSRDEEERATAAEDARRVVEAILALPPDVYDELPETVREAMES